MTSALSTTASARQIAAQRQIDAFTRRFGKAHLDLAYHAAFPLSLTSDLLYKLQANFQTTQTGGALHIPWIAVADLLLSGLCREVGHELYEMDAAIRNELLNQLKNEPRFGQRRLEQLADFVLTYIQHQLDSPDQDTRELARTQRWTALAYIRPGTATCDLIVALSSLDLSESAEWLRLTSLIETLAEPLAGFEPLLSYAQGMKFFMRGDVKEATDQLSPLAEAGRIRICGVELPVPEQIQDNFASLKTERSQNLQTQDSVAVDQGSHSIASNVQNTGSSIITLNLKLTPEEYIKAGHLHFRKFLLVNSKRPLLAIFIILYLILVIFTPALAINHFLISGKLNESFFLLISKLFVLILPAIFILLYLLYSGF